MRVALAIVLVCGGCRSILGIEEATLPSPDDASIDMAGGDGMSGGEMTTNNCPASFVPLANSGPRGHRYMVISSNATWVLQRDACAAGGQNIFMAFPDGATATDAALELAALRTAANDGAWIGVDDVTSEGTYRNTRNMLISSATMALVMTGSQPGQKDCFVIQQTNIVDEDCTTQRKTICECIP